MLNGADSEQQIVSGSQSKPCCPLCGDPYAAAFASWLGQRGVPLKLPEGRAASALPDCQSLFSPLMAFRQSYKAASFVIVFA